MQIYLSLFLWSDAKRGMTSRYFFFFRGYGKNRIPWKLLREWGWWWDEITPESLNITSMKSYVAFILRTNPPHAFFFPFYFWSSSSFHFYSRFLAFFVFFFNESWLTLSFKGYRLWREAIMCPILLNEAPLGELVKDGSYRINMEHLPGILAWPIEMCI